jgi:hypothetical protein
MCGADKDKIDRVLARQWAERAQQWASMSPNEQLVLTLLQEVFWYVVAQECGEIVAAAMRGMKAEEIAQLIEKNPGLVEEDLVNAYESQTGRPMGEADRDLLRARLREELPKAIGPNRMPLPSGVEGGRVGPRFDPKKLENGKKRGQRE